MHTHTHNPSQLQILSIFSRPLHSVHCVLSPQKLFVPGTDHHLRQLLNNFFNLFFHMFNVRLALNVWWCGRDRKRDRAHTDSKSSLGIFFMAKASAASWERWFRGMFDGARISLMEICIFWYADFIFSLSVCLSAIRHSNNFFATKIFFTYISWKIWKKKYFHVEYLKKKSQTQNLNQCTPRGWIFIQVSEKGIKKL